MTNETHYSGIISGDASAVIQRWVKENNLTKNGKLWTLGMAVRAIAEDFADVLIKDEEILLQEEQEIQKIKCQSKKE